MDELQAEMLYELKEIKENLAELNELKQKINDLGALKVLIKVVVTKNKELKVQNAKMARKLEEIEAYQRSNNLEINCVPLIQSQ